MNILKAIKRTSTSTGQVNKLSSDGFIPAILYGGKKSNLKISIKKLHLQDFIKTETFMSKIFDMEIDGNAEKVLPRDIAYDPVSDEPIHIDFVRIAKGSKLILEIPVKFINQDKSPGLKKGGVLNIVRRKVELKCPIENIPDEIVVDLNNTKLPENIVPTITDRDFVIATIAPPTILVEPEKTDEEAPAEGETPAEGTTEDATEEAATTEEGKNKSAKPVDDKSKDKSAKAADGKAKVASSNKGKSTNKEKETKKK